MLDGAAHHDSGRHCQIGEPTALRPAGVERLAGEHHVERQLWSDQLGQTAHASPAREDSEHDFRQAKPGRRFVDDNAVAAGERQFEAAAQAMAADQRRGREPEGSDAVEELPAARQQFVRTLGRIERREFANVGASDETSLFR